MIRSRFRTHPRMFPKTCPLPVLALVLSVAGAPCLLAEPPGPGLAGVWSGRATLTNDWPGFTCRYEATDTPPGVRLEILADGTGSVSIAIEPAAGSGCPPLHKRYTVAAAQAGEGALRFTDSGGHEWSLGLRKGEDVLKGLVAWKSGDEPLAADFKPPSGTAPLTRLSGEVRLGRAAAPPAAAAGGAGPAASAAPVEKVTAGKRVSHFGSIVAVNVVAAGALYGANKFGQSKEQTGGVVTCSPRNCIIAGLGEPCLCNANVLSGAPCGSNPTGAPQQSACNTTDLPCQSGLSCNAGLCQDRFGSCPF